MATLTQLRTRVAGKIGLTNTAQADQPKLTDWANEGVADVLTRTHCAVREGTLAFTAGTSVYTLPTAVMAIKDAWNQGATHDGSLERVPVDFLNRLSRNTSGAVGPTRYYTVQGHDLLKVWPPPAADEDLRIDYVPRPTTLTADGDSPTEIPLEWHKAVELYMLWQAADYDDDTTSAQGDRYRRDYITYVEDIKRALMKKQGNYGRAIVNRRRVRKVAHDRSAYPQVY